MFARASDHYVVGAKAAWSLETWRVHQDHPPAVGVLERGPMVCPVRIFGRYRGVAEPFETGHQALHGRRIRHVQDQEVIARRRAAVAVASCFMLGKLKVIRLPGQAQHDPGIPAVTTERGNLWQAQAVTVEAHNLR